MDIEKSKYETSNRQRAGEPGSAGAISQRLLDRGAEVYGQAEQAVSDVYDRTAQAVSKTYDQAKNFSSENPGKAMLIASGIGLGLGFFLAATSRRPRIDE